MRFDRRLQEVSSLWCFAAVFLNRYVHARRLPEASSTLLRLHQQYLRQPPHDTSFYDVLQVSPNATASEIDKSYRKLSRKLHPDKHRSIDNDGAKEALERVRQAYEILRDDRTRLPYHRHGLVNAQDAVLILTGRGGYHQDPALIQELLQLMGYCGTNQGQHPSPMQERQQRVWLIASNLIELMRPVVEGALTDDSCLMDHVIRQCDRLKSLPLGAQIVRCVGRAYRYQGRRAMQKHRHHATYGLNHPNRRTRSLIAWKDAVSDAVREAKQIATAAVAGSRVLWNERALLNNKRVEPDEHGPSFFGCPSDELDDVGMDTLMDGTDYAPLTDEDIKEKEKRKADMVLLESLQVEAFWKICKIDLDRVVREACDLILTGDYFFFPSHYSYPWSGADEHRNALESDGWVGSRGVAIDAPTATHRAASLLVRMGDIMVQRSKQGTAWME
jgi:DnaJ domain/X-domain of DnaJ-containing